jgi:beta-N-acetylglucosaminidase
MKRSVIAMCFTMELLLIITTSMALSQPEVKEKEVVKVYSCSKPVVLKSNSSPVVKSLPITKEKQDPSPNRGEIDREYSLLYLTGYSSEDYNKMLAGTPLSKQGESFVRVEEIEKVNGLFMASLTGQEQGFGTGELARERNNLTSFGAWDDNKYHATRFKSFDHCLMFTARWLRTQYLTKGGKYYHGVTVHSVNVMYASDKTWADNIIIIMKRLKSKL